MQGPGSLGVVSEIIVAGGGQAQGVFVYSANPGTGDLFASMSNSTLDPYGDTVTPGVSVYGTNNQIVNIQVVSGLATIQFLSGAASEVVPSRIITTVFNRGLANEQIATFIEGPRGSASPVDRVNVSLFDTALGLSGTATGFLEYESAGATPAALVQTSPAGTSTGGTITLTLPANATVGNCLVVYINGDSTNGTDPHVSGVTINGVADHFAAGGTASGSTNVAIWLDPNNTQASRTIVVTFTGGTGNQLCSAFAEEWSGVATATPVDQTSANGSGGPGTTYTSNTTSGLAAIGEVAFGICASDGATSIGQGAGFTGVTAGNGAAKMIGGHQVLSGITGVAYAGSITPSTRYSALVVVVKANVPGTFIRPAAWGIQGIGLLLVNKSIATVPASSPAVAETWHTPSLNSGFAALGGAFSTPQYQYEAVNGGRTRLRGVVNITANQVAGATMFTLPAGYRPAASKDLPAANSISGGPNAPLQITSAGNVNLNNSATSGNFISLDGVCFELD